MLNIRPAVKEDVRVIFSLICELAEFEKLRHAVVATKEQIEKTLFGQRPFAEALVAEWDGVAVGFALFFHTFSTFVGKPGLYLEDLFVRPSHRKKGIGKALMVHLAKMAKERNCSRFEWAVLNWNEQAIHFYKSLGAVAMDEWTVYRISDEALEKLSGSL